MHVPAPGPWTPSTPTLLRVSCQFTVDPSATVRALTLTTVVPQSDTRAAGSGLAALTGGSTCTREIARNSSVLDGDQRGEPQGAAGSRRGFPWHRDRWRDELWPVVGRDMVDPAQRSCAIGVTQVVYANVNKGKSPCRQWTKTRVPSAIKGPPQVRSARWAPSDMRSPDACSRHRAC